MPKQPGRFLAVLAISLLALPGVSHAQNVVVDYGHRALDCDWLEAEYERVIERSQSGQPTASLLKPKLMLLPLFFLSLNFTYDIESVLPPAQDLGGRVRFSSDPADIAEASYKRNCYHFTDRLLREQESGTAPPPTPKLSNLRDD